MYVCLSFNVQFLDRTKISVVAGWMQMVLEPTNQKYSP